MKYIALLLLLIPLSLFGQVESQFNGTLNIFSGYRIGSTNTFTISGIFSSTTSQYTSSQVDTGDVIQVLSGSQFYWFHVYSIASSSGGVITCNVRDSTSTRTVAPTGIVNLFRPTPNLRLPLQADGISNAAKSSVFNTLALRVDEIQTSVASATNCEQTFTKNNHGFRKWTPIYWTGSTYVRPPYDSLVPDYIVVDSLTANTFKVANCGTYTTTLANGLYWFTNQSPGYSLTADTTKVPLFQVLNGKLLLQPIVGFNLMSGSGSGSGITDLTGDVTASGTGSVVATVANNAITSAKIASQTVDSLDLKNRVITTVKIVDANVTLAKLATNAVDSTKAANLSPSDLAQTGAATNDVLTWTGTKYAPRASSGSIPSVLARSDSTVVLRGGQLYYKNNPRIFNVKDFGAKGDGVTIDRQKIQNAIDSCFANGGGDVYFPNGIYNLGDTVITNTWQGVNPNSQLYIPFDIIDATTPAKIDSSQKRRMIRLLGEFTQNTLTPIYFASGVAQFDDMTPHRSGVILLSKHNNTVSAAAATKPPAVIGSIGRTDAFGSFNWGNVFIENIRVRVTVDTTIDYPKMIGIDASNIVRVHIKNSVVDIDVRSLTLANPPDYASYGIVMPRINCDVEQNVEAVNVIGFWAGIVPGEHTKISSIGVYNAINAILVPLCTHSVLIENARLQGSKYQIAALQANIFSGQITTGVARIKGNIINVERNIAQAPTSYNYTTFVNDPSNRLYANINYHIVTSNVGVTNLQFNKNGGTNVVADSLGSAGSSGSYVNGGNSFGANATIGTNDNFDLSIKTNNTTRYTHESDGSSRWFGGSSGERWFGLKGGFTDGTFTTPFSFAALNSAESDAVNLVTTSFNNWLRTTGSGGVLISPAANGFVPTGQLSVAAISGSTKDALDIYHSTTKRFAINSYGNIARGSGISTSRVNLLNFYNEAGARQIMLLDTVGNFKLFSTDATDNRGFYFQRNSTDANASLFRFLKSRGTESSPSTVSNGDFLGSILWTPRGSTTYSAGIAYMGAIVTGSPSGDNVPISLFFKSGTSSSGNPNLLLHSNGNIAIGDFGAAGSFTTPTAKLHLAAGTATASTAPLKLTSGTSLTTAEAGAIEYDGTEFYATNSTASRTILARVLKGSNTLDFGNTAAGAVTDLTITVTGAADGDVVSLSVPNSSQTTTGSFSAWVSATNTVTVRYRIAALVGAEDPASGTFKVTVTK